MPGRCGGGRAGPGGGVGVGWMGRVVAMGARRRPPNLRKSILLFLLLVVLVLLVLVLVVLLLS